MGLTPPPINTGGGGLGTNGQAYRSYSGLDGGGAAYGAGAGSGSGLGMGAGGRASLDFGETTGPGRAFPDVSTAEGRERLVGTVRYALDRFRRGLNEAARLDRSWALVWG